MTKTITGILIAGIAAMLSFSAMPANAAPPENICVQQGGLGLSCQMELAEGQHVALILTALSPGSTSGCHYDVSESGSPFGPTWIFSKDHGPDRCSPIFVILQDDVDVIGQ